MEAYFKQINTMGLKGKLRLAMVGYSVNEQLEALHSLSKELRRTNSVRINDKQMGRRVDEREDEVRLKAD